MLRYSNQDWSKLSDAFQSVVFLLQDANLKQRTMASEVNLILIGNLNNARNSLDSSFSSLLGKPVSENTNVEIELSMREIIDLGNGLQALHWAGLSNKNGQILGSYLISLSKEISALERDIFIATTRTKVLEPKDRLSLAKRIIATKALLSFVEKSLSKSAYISRQPLEPNTQANENNPLSMNNLDFQSARECFSRLSVETSLLPEFSKIVSSELEACHSFSSCPIINNQAKDFTAIIERVLSINAKDEKIMLSVSNAICK